jgi:hypothetical protein
MNDQETNQAQQVPVAPPVPPVVPIAPVSVPVTPVMLAPSRRVAPGLALVLSFFPGLGHLYLGMYRRGTAVFLAFVASIYLADKAGLGVLVPFVVFFALIDAYRHAQFINSGVPVEVEEPIVGHRGQRKGALGFGVFITVLGVILLYNQFYPINFEFLRDWWPMFLVAGGLWLVGSYAWDRHKQNAAQGDSQLSL